jgi:hypothetical protein
MNRIYRLVWNHLTQSLVAVAECGRGRGKRPSATPRVPPKAPG